VKKQNPGAILFPMMQEDRVDIYMMKNYVFKAHKHFAAAVYGRMRNSSLRYCQRPLSFESL
jgi:hypothetical protein